MVVLDPTIFEYIVSVEILARNLHHMPSAECKKVVSDILGEIEFFTVIESTDKMTYFEP